MTDQLFYLLSAVLLGIVVGALIMYFASGKRKNSAKKIAEVEDKLNNYQQDVVQHFEQTADLVDELTNSYKKVFDHLGKSARQLLTDEQVEEQIEKRKDNLVTLGFLSDEGSEIVATDAKSKEQESEDSSDDSQLFKNKANEGDKKVDEDVEQDEKEIEELVEEIEDEINKNER